MRLHKLKQKSVTDATADLEGAVRDFIKNARWFPYGEKINRLRIPLLELRRAKLRQLPHL